MTIFAGEVEFTTPRPFEAKSARVKLSFTVEAGEDAVAVAAFAGAAARAKAFEMIGESVPVQVEEQKRGRGRPPANPSTTTTDAATTVAPGAEVTVHTASPFGAAGVPVPSEQGSAPASATVLNSPSPMLAPPPIAVITEVMLSEECAAKAQAAPGKTQAIKDLIATYLPADAPVKHSRLIPVEQRTAFIEALRAL